MSAGASLSIRFALSGLVFDPPEVRLPKQYRLLAKGTAVLLYALIWSPQAALSVTPQRSSCVALAWGLLLSTKPCQWLTVTPAVLRPFCTEPLAAVHLSLPVQAAYKKEPVLGDSLCCSVFLYHL